ncbi:unnamed protein product [Coffea canephora]|uniref:Cation/H+ exchanger transmembrane domain-containing protein n=1 Tax=Coffea canephora TaxID=49390 RepID=A0A068URE3_COFCA|nr:unnamed protein product [Coffea canephora]
MDQGMLPQFFLLIYFLIITIYILGLIGDGFQQSVIMSMFKGGILLRPSALGRNEDFMQWIFPAWSTPILESVASMGLLFFLLLIGLELDLSSIRRRGNRAFGIVAASMSLPFLLGVGLTFLTRKVVNGDNHHKYGQLLMFMGVSLSITAFLVLARILAELRLLTMDVG